MCSGGSDWTCLQPGFPIRKSSDHSLVIDYPRLIADSYVLLRFLVPRHPPCALKNLATKMLASTVQFSKYGRYRLEPTACPHLSPGRGRSVRTGPCPRRSPTPSPEGKRKGLIDRSERLPLPASGPSGPNSAPSELTLHHPVPADPHEVSSCTKDFRSGRSPTSQCSTLEPHRGTNVRA